MNALERNGFTDTWRALGARLPRPRAILVVSAHWFFGATAVAAMSRPRTIHDFYGFPQKLFEFDYPAPGAPDVAGEVAEIAKLLWVGLDRDQWGRDHGTWSVLTHLYPEADVPVVQLSINALKPLAYHLDVGARLARLRERGIMILGSGNIVHNLKRVQWKQPDAAFDWARRFDDAAVVQLAEDPAAILKLREHPDFELAVPTPDHFIPLLYIAGLAAAGEGMAERWVRGYAVGSLSMTCYKTAPRIARRFPKQERPACPPMCRLTRPTSNQAMGSGTMFDSERPPGSRFTALTQAAPNRPPGAIVSSLSHTHGNNE